MVNCGCDGPVLFLCREELGKNINADEAAAMGAVYQAAALSKAFKVKPFLVRDAAVFPIQVSMGLLHPVGDTFKKTITAWTINYIYP